MEDRRARCCVVRYWLPVWGLVVRLGIILAIITVVLGSGWKAYAMIDRAGYDRATVEYQAEIAVIRAEAAQDVADNWRVAQAIAGAETDDEIRIVEKIRTVERDVPIYIEKIVEVKPECADLPELGGLFSIQAEAANNRSSGLAPDTG